MNLLLPYAHLVLFPVPASMSASYRKTFVTSGAKDDPTDAGWILDLLLRHRDCLRRLQSDEPNTRLLLMLVEDRRQLVMSSSPVIPTPPSLLPFPAPDAQPCPG